MYCNKCGTQANDDAQFCSKCGASLLIAPSMSQIRSEDLSLSPNATQLSFGSPINRWWGPFKGKSSFPKSYEWLEQRNTLLICRNHLVLLQGDEKRSAALDIIQAMGLVGGVVGAIRNLSDSLFNKRFELSSEVASRLFENKLMVWCNKSDATIWRYHEKPWMFIKSSSEQLYCKFNSQAGVLHACFVLWCTAEYTGHGKGDIDGIGCRIADVGNNIPEKKVPEAMAASRMNLPN